MDELPPVKPMTYKEAGVDIDAGDEMVDLIRPLVERTYTPRVMSGYGGFAGLFRLDFNEKLFKQQLQRAGAGRLLRRRGHQAARSLWR